jgi:bifunctional DNA-binding transcriptional regulator/antitoxin component of YhaV-PrlF toxin-antitoxin module
MRITSRGQVTIPQVIREKYGFMPETDVEFVERDGWIGIQRADQSKPDRIQEFIDRLSGSATTGLTTDEIMELTRSYSEDV